MPAATSTTPAVQLRPPRARDQEAFLAAVRASRKLHHPWVQPPDTAEAFRLYLARARRPDFDANLLVGPDDALVGVINLSQIFYGGFCSAYLGYYAFAPHQGRGFLREGLRRVLGRAFLELGLHRVEANLQPGNSRSRALVAAAGFRQEGFSPRYLKIGGRWRDHERWALLADEFDLRPPARARR